MSATEQTLQRTRERVRESLEWVRGQMESGASGLELEELAKARDDLEGTLAILEGAEEVPDPRIRTRTVRLSTGSREIRVPAPPPFSDEEEVREPIPYDYEHGRIFGSSPAATADLSESDLEKISARVLREGEEPESRSCVEALEAIGQSIYVDLPDGDEVEYCAVLDNPIFGKAWAVFIARNPELEGGQRRVHWVWTTGPDQGRARWRRASQRLASDFALKNRGDALEDVRRKIVRKTNQDSERGGYYMVNGSDTVDEVSFYGRTKRKRNRNWREATGIEDGLFVYRSSPPPASERRFCPL
jgi:hypothetical protein